MSCEYEATRYPQREAGCDRIEGSEEVKETLQRLRELTERLPLLGVPEYRSHGYGIVDLKVVQGSCAGIPLLNIPEVAVQRVIMEPGTILTPHKHDELEIIIMVKGEAVRTLPNGEDLRLERGDVYTASPGEEQVFRAVTYCDLIAVSIPAASNYPKTPEVPHARG